MMKNLIIIAFRHFKRHKTHTLTNLAGLTLGITGFIIILLFVQDELKFDRFHTHIDRLARLEVSILKDGQTSRYALSAPAMGPGLVSELPEVINMVRFFYQPETAFKYQDFAASDSFIFSDNSLLELFSFSLIQGDSKQILKETQSIILSESLASRLHLPENPVGKILKVNQIPMTITGVFRDISKNSHIQTHAFVSMKTIESDKFWGNGVLTDWSSFNFYTYLELDANSDRVSLEQKINTLLKKNVSDGLKQNISGHLENMKNIYLDSQAQYNRGPRGNRLYLNIFIFIMFLILILAAINYINMTTARISYRSREVSIRKVLGSRKGSLMIQFLTESVLLSVSASLIAVAIIELFLPYLNILTGKEMVLFSSDNSIIISAISITAIFMGLIAGIIPAIQMSLIKPAMVLKNNQHSLKSGLFRKILVVFQFSISICLIIITLLITSQMSFISKINLGFKKNNILYIPLKTDSLKERTNILKSRFSEIPEINSCTITSRIIGNVKSGWNFRKQGASEEITVTTLFTDHDFLKTFGIKLKEGRNFNPQAGTDEKTAFLVNSQTVNKLGLSHPVNTPVKLASFKEGFITGVIDDIHFQPLNSKISPLVITYTHTPRFNLFLAVNIKEGGLQEFITKGEAAWKELAPDQPFNWLFQDDQLAKLYHSEKRLKKVFSLFASFSILIGCLGLFGLVSFVAEKKTKEIGIRKVMGASVGKIILILIGEFTQLVLISNIIAWPLAWYFTKKWLLNFAYRTDINILIFIGTALAVYGITLLTTSATAFQAANRNPVQALKYE